MKKVGLFFLASCVFVFFACGVVEKLANKNPLIKSVSATPSQIGTQDTTLLRVVAEDPDGDMLSFRWSSSAGELINNSGEEVHWVAPDLSGVYRIEVKVLDENGGKATGDVKVNVKGDESPIVTIVQPVENQIIPGIGTITIAAQVVFDWQIERVDFFLDRDSLLYSDAYTPYRYDNWDITGLSGQKMIVARAYEKGNLANYGEDSVHVYIEGVVPVPQ